MRKGGLYGAKAYVKALRQSSVEMTNNIADELCEKAKSVTPVVTGTLRDGYQVRHASGPGQSAELFNPVEYHDYVNDGTDKMAPRAMIETAIASINPDARKYIRKA